MSDEPKKEDPRAVSGLPNSLTNGIEGQEEAMIDDQKPDPQHGGESGEPGSLRLEGEVRRFVAHLEEAFPNRFRHRPKVLKKRTITLFQRLMPPYPKPTGRPRLRWVTAAT
ncbi:MAG: hypothetical protein L0338_33395, partial [Acidobacteria bacterium]|nr:hypothetical protein [Acidobacteriota bacterium]